MARATMCTFCDKSQELDAPRLDSDGGGLGYLPLDLSRGLRVDVGRVRGMTNTYTHAHMDIGASTPAAARACACLLRRSPLRPDLRYSRRLFSQGLRYSRLLASCSLLAAFPSAKVAPPLFDSPSRQAIREFTLPVLRLVLRRRKRARPSNAGSLECPESERERERVCV